MLDRFSFERQELGQDVFLSDVIAAAQAVAGVDYVDVLVFGGIPEKKADIDDQNQPIRRLLTPQEMSKTVASFLAAAPTPNKLPWRIRVQLAGFEAGTMRPAQLAYLSPTVADTLVVNQIH
jgi:hypothetical protein